MSLSKVKHASLMLPALLILSACLDEDTQKTSSQYSIVNADGYVFLLNKDNGDSWRLIRTTERDYNKASKTNDLVEVRWSPMPKYDNRIDEAKADNIYREFVLPTPPTQTSP